MKENKLKQNTLIPFTLIGAALIGIYFGFLEPSLKELTSLGLQQKEILSKLTVLRKTFTEETAGQTKTRSSNDTIYLMNYLDALILKSDIIKLKSFQPVGAQGAKSVPAYQIRFAANANALLKFMYLSEKTLPRLAISSCRASSIAGGSYSGMRQLECQLTVSLFSKGNKKEIKIAGLEKFKAVYRDPFSEIVREEPKPEPEAEPEAEAPEIPKWTLTAVMSEGDADTLLFKKERFDTKRIVTLKRTGVISLAWGKDQVELKTGGVVLVWALGETKGEDVLSKEIKEAIQNGDSGKGVIATTPELAQPEEKPAEAEITIKELPGSPQRRGPRDQLRNSRNNRSGGN